MSASAVLALAALLVAHAPAARAGEIQLDSRYQPGDSYRLSLRVGADTESKTSRGGGESVVETVQLEYHAVVEVLEVGPRGRPVLERHGEVALTFSRPGESGSFFLQGAAWQVRRDAAGMRIDSAGPGVDRQTLDRAREILAGQFEYTPIPRLLDPGHPVSIGESWELDSGLTKRLLNERGLPAASLRKPGRATLVRSPAEPGSSLRIRYEIPVAWFELATHDPANASDHAPIDHAPRGRTDRSEAMLSGELQLGQGNAAPVAHESRLELRMAGRDGEPGSGGSRPWSLVSSRSSAQSTVLVGANGIARAQH